MGRRHEDDAPNYTADEDDDESYVEVELPPEDK